MWVFLVVGDYICCGSHRVNIKPTSRAKPAYRLRKKVSKYDIALRFSTEDAGDFRSVDCKSLDS